MNGPTPYVSPTDMVHSYKNDWTYPETTFIFAVIKIGTVSIITLFVLGSWGTKLQESIKQSIGFMLVKNYSLNRY